MGIEPTSKAWEALILPLNYARSEETVPQDLEVGQWGEHEKGRGIMRKDKKREDSPQRRRVR
jgi:hypothetical protein